MFFESCFWSKSACGINKPCSHIFRCQFWWCMYWLPLCPWCPWWSLLSLACSVSPLCCPEPPPSCCQGSQPPSQPLPADPRGDHWKWVKIIGKPKKINDGKIHIFYSSLMIEKSKDIRDSGLLWPSMTLQVIVWWDLRSSTYLFPVF